MKPSPFIIPIFISHAACPHRCVFCDQTSITGHQHARHASQQVRNRVTEFLGFRGNRQGPVEVAFYGGNFLGLPIKLRCSLLDEAQEFVEKGKVDSIRFSTRPDSIISGSLKEIASYAVRVVEVGAQSMDDNVLSLSRRGHTAEDTRKAVKLIKTYGLRVCVQIMPGLPGSTREGILETGWKVAELKPDFVRIYPTVVVKNTVLEHWYRSGRFKPLSLAGAVEVTKTLYLLFKARGISVIRMGLQATDSLLAPGVVVAGPFHPAFGHLVHSAVFLDLAVRELEAQTRPFKRISFRVHPHDVPKLKGLNNHNLRALTQRFRLERLYVLPDAALPRDALRVEEPPHRARDCSHRVH